MQMSGVRWAWLLAAAFLLGTVVVAMMTLHITAPAPQVADGASLPDRIFASFKAEQAAWLQDAGSSVLFAIGFLAIASLGPILRALFGPDDPRATRVAILFVVAGTIGIVSQMIYIGGKEVTAVPYYCDCQYGPEQLLSRGAILDALVGIRDWLLGTCIFVLSLGLLSTAELARAWKWTDSLVVVTRLLAIAGLATVAWNRIAAPVLANAQVDLPYDLIGLGLTVAVAGVGVPLWGMLLGRFLSAEAAA
jgi:hypothetical protein